MTSITTEQLLLSLRDELGEEAEGVEDCNLLKFLRWKADVGRAAGRYRCLLKWRKENPFALDKTPLQASQDHTLKRVLETQFLVAPDGMVDKKGHTVLVGRFRNNDMSDGRTPKDVVRMCIYTLKWSCSLS